MKHLFRFAKSYTKECILAPLFKALEVCFELCVPLVMKKIIDVGIAGVAENPAAYIGWMSALLVLLGALGLCATVTAQYFAAKASVGIVARLRHALLKHIQGLSYTELDRLGTSTMITRMTGDLNQVQSGINLTLRLFLRSPFVVIGAAVMAFTIDPTSAVTFAVVIPLLSVVVFGIMLWCLPLYKKVQQRLDRVMLMVRENLAGVRVIRAFRREKTEEKRFDGACEELLDDQNLVNRLSALMNPLTYVLINLAVLVLIRIGAVRVNDGIITQGAVIAMYNYMAQISVELIKFANLIITMTKSVACEKRVESVFEMTSSQKTPAQVQETTEHGTVTFDRVTLCYAGAGAPSVKDLSFRAFDGEMIGIIGSTGSGKTSVVNLIPRLYDATEGTVLVDGADVKMQDMESLRKKIGVVQQKAVLFRGTIRENLLWGNENADDDTLREALEAAQAADFVAEKGLDAPVEQNGRNFSGGQRQRLTIARALVRRPEILILDDSTSALDFATDAALRQAIRALPYHPTVFLVSQRTSSIRHADRILVMEDGNVAGIGTHEQLLEHCEVYREIHESQFKKEEAR